MSTALDISAAAAEVFNAAHAAYVQGHPADALQHLASEVFDEPVMERVWLLRARCQVALGEWMPAREAFSQTLRLNMGNYSAWLEAGHLCRQMGELQQAALSYQRAIDVAPHRYEALLGMARVLAQQGELAVAEQAYADAVLAGQQMAKHDVLRQIHTLMGQYWLELGQSPRAMACFAKALGALEHEPEMTAERAVNIVAEVQMDWAMALLRLGQREPAMQRLSLASAATTEATLARLVSVSYRNNFWQEAVEIARRAAALYPTSIPTLWNLAHVLAECWRMEEALEVLAQAEALGPVTGARALRATVANRTGEVDRSLELYLELARSDASYASSAAMSSLYTDQLSAQEVADLHRALFAPLGEGARAKDSFVRSPLAGRQLKLGIVSADFHHQHPVNIFMQPVLRELDRTKFEVVMYFTGVSHDEQTLLARTRVSQWVECSTLNDVQLAKRIDADGIDVLLDMAGHTGQQRMALFGRRAAPVQMTYLGYPGSTGVPHMDWMLGDAVVTPQGCDSLYSEQLWRLPGTVFCFAPEEDYLFPNFTAQHAERPLTFGSFNNATKLTPHTLRLWARVLESVPQSRMVLRAPSFSDEGAVRSFSERLSALGVDLSRVEFRGPVGLTDMMADYADIDIALDPVPYNGGTTSLQAMWMGVPVLTQMGAHFVSRMGASFMTAAGLPEWVAQDDDGYVAIAQQMASDRNALLALKQGLRARLQNQPAWNVQAHVRALEEALLATVS
jgi:protein O-GlcNAc transferase